MELAKKVSEHFFYQTRYLGQGMLRKSSCFVLYFSNCAINSICECITVMQAKGITRMRSLSINEIGIFSSHRGVNKRDVEDFLDTVGQAGTEEGALLNLYYDARLYNWNISTVRAIESGIRTAYMEEEAKGEKTEKRIGTPLPGAHYSLWPQRNY
jgi:hypothetical protein